MISTHILDTELGRPAAGVAVSLYFGEELGPETALAASAKGGMSGSTGRRVADETASARSLPSLISGSEAPTSAKPRCTCPATMSVIDCGVLR